MPLSPLKLLSTLLGREVTKSPTRTVSEWVGRKPSEAALTKLASQENKLIPEAYVGPERVRHVSESDNIFSEEAVKAQLEAMDRYIQQLEKYAKFQDPTGIYRQAALENRDALIKSFAQAKEDPSKVLTRHGEKIFMSPNIGYDYPRVSSPEQLAIEGYRQSPGAFQQLARKGALRAVDRDIIRENAIIGGSYSPTVEEAVRRYEMLAKLVDQPLKLKNEKLPLYRGLELPTSSVESSLYGEGFGSFSYNPDVAVDFVGGRTPSRTGVLARLVPENRKTVKGLDISDNRFNPSGGAYSDVGNELEVLLSPRQGFGVKDYAITPEGQLLLEIFHDPSLLKGSNLYRRGGLVQMRNR